MSILRILNVEAINVEAKRCAVQSQTENSSWPLQSSSFSSSKILIPDFTPSQTPSPIETNARHPSTLTTQHHSPNIS